MNKFKLNYNAMGLRARGESWEEYSLELKPMLLLNVHNRTESGAWVFEICALRVLKSKKEFDTKEAAIAACLKSVKTNLNLVINSLEV